MRIIHLAKKTIQIKDQTHICKQYIGKDVDFIYIEIIIFLLQNAINSFYSLYDDYWSLITKYWPGSSRWNASFKSLFQYFVRSFKQEI